MELMVFVYKSNLKSCGQISMKFPQVILTLAQDEQMIRFGW